MKLDIALPATSLALTALFGGYNCFFVGGIYYRPEFYQGTTVYVVVQ